jgi:hypothetical protein
VVGIKFSPFSRRESSAGVNGWPERLWMRHGAGLGGPAGGVLKPEAGGPASGPESGDGGRTTWGR